MILFVDNERITKVVSPLEDIARIEFMTAKTFIISDLNHLSVMVRFDDDYDDEFIFAYSASIEGSALFIQSKL